MTTPLNKCKKRLLASKKRLLASDYRAEKIKEKFESMTPEEQTSLIEDLQKEANESL